MNKTEFENYEAVEAVYFKVKIWFIQRKDFETAPLDKPPARRSPNISLINIFSKNSFVGNRVGNRRIFLGTLWFRNKSLKANRKEWVLEIFKRKNVEALKPLVLDLEWVFNVKIIKYLNIG